MDNIKDIIDSEFDKIESFDLDDDSIKKLVEENNNALDNEKVDKIIRIINNKYPNIDINDIDNKKIEEIISEIK